MKGERMTVAFFSAYDSYVPAFSGKKKESGLLIKFDNGPSYFRKFPLPADIRNADLGKVAEYLAGFTAVQPFAGAHLVIVSGGFPREASFPGGMPHVEEIAGHPIREATDLEAIFRAFSHVEGKDWRVPDDCWKYVHEKYVHELGWYFRTAQSTPSHVTESGVVMYFEHLPFTYFPLFTHTEKGLERSDGGIDTLRGLHRVNLLSTRRFDRMERQEDGTSAHVFYEPFHADNAKAVFAMLFPEAP